MKPTDWRLEVVQGGSVLQQQKLIPHSFLVFHSRVVVSSFCVCCVCVAGFRPTV